MDGRLGTYRTMETTTKSQIELILQVYDGAITSLKNASQALSDNRRQSADEELERAKRFLTHLYTTLDFDKGGEIALQLGQLYAFLINQTNVVMATKDLSLLDDNVNILSNIRQGWQGIKDRETKQPPVSQRTLSPAGTAQVNESA